MRSDPGTDRVDRQRRLLDRLGRAARTGGRLQRAPAAARRQHAVSLRGGTQQRRCSLGAEDPRLLRLARVQLELLSTDGRGRVPLADELLVRRGTTSCAADRGLPAPLERQLACRRTECTGPERRLDGGLRRTPLCGDRAAARAAERVGGNRTGSAPPRAL